MGPKSNDNGPYKRKVRGYLRHRIEDTDRRGGGNVTTEAEMGGMWSQAKGC